MTLEGALLRVWRSTMVEDAPAVELEGQAFPVRTTAKKRLREVDFVFHRQEFAGFGTKPGDRFPMGGTRPWGAQVMQFLSAGRYVANVVDGKVTRHGRKGNRQGQLE